jgi:hypothetical protein
MYVAIKLDDFSKEFILKDLKNFIPKWSIVLNDAILYQGLAKKWDIIGKRYELVATHFGYSDGAFALKVKTGVREGKSLIVPIAINKNKGYKISETNNIKTWFNLKNKFTIRGILSQYKNGDKVEESQIPISNKSKNNAMRVAFYDFDNTITNVPTAEFGKKFWERTKETPYTKIGWWSKEESLDTDVFDFKPIIEVVSRLKRDFENPNCWTVLLTNRLEKLKDNVKTILDNLGVDLDEFKMVTKGGMTKPMRIKEVLEDMPQCTMIEIYDDDPGNIELFRELKKELEMDGKSVTIFFVNPKHYTPRLTKIV